MSMLEVLCQKCNKIWNTKKIYWYFTINGVVRIRQTENGPYKRITHLKDLKTVFLEEQIS